MTEAVADFRSVIEEKLRAKKSALDETEQNLKRYTVLRDNFNSSGGGGGGAGRVGARGRLGPPRGGGGIGRGGGRANFSSGLEGRLGPKVASNDEPFEATEERAVMSRVVVEQQKSRDDALAEEEQHMDRKEKQVCVITLGL